MATKLRFARGLLDDAAQDALAGFDTEDKANLAKARVIIARLARKLDMAAHIQLDQEGNHGID